MFHLLLLGCAYTLGVPRVEHGAGEVRLPLVHPSTDPRRIYLPMEAGELGPWLWFVDTGYSYSTCDDDLVEALGLDLGGRSPVRGELGTLQTRKARLPDLRFGPHTVRGLVCQTRDLHTTSSIGDPPEVPVAGVLGMDALRAFDVDIDGPWLTLTPPTRDRPEGPGVVRLRREWGVGTRVTLRLTIDGAPDRLLLDTGATDTYVDGERLRLEAARVERGVTVRGTGKGGATTRDLVHYDVAGVHLGDHVVGPVTLTDRPKGPFTPGLLGLDVLDDLRQTYRWRARRAVFTPSTAGERPAWEDRPEGAVKVVR